MSGDAKDARALAIRLATRIAEPFYATAMRVRNTLFNSGLRIHRLPRPVISIGNITTGGTGKTPVVQWLARKLIASSHRPAVLMRGYTVGGSTISDEATLLERSLNIPVAADPDRVRAGEVLVRDHPDIDVILLDDGFQHRKLYRDLDVVLIDATNAFGYGHILPRGMLREPLAGLRRADVIVVTRSDRVESREVTEITQRLGDLTSGTVPILRARHQITRIVRADESLPIESLRGKRIFSFCGIGNPSVFQRDLLAAGAIDLGNRWFGDHHDYSRQEMQTLSDQAKQDAEMMVTTEKDWVKIEALAFPERIPIWRAQLEMHFDEPDASQLLSRIESLIASYPSSPESPATPERAGRSTQ